MTRENSEISLTPYSQQLQAAYRDRPIAFLLKAREALRNCLIDLRSVRVEETQITLTVDGKAPPDIEPQWVGLYRRLQAVKQAVLGDAVNGKSFRTTWEQDLHDHFAHFAHLGAGENTAKFTSDLLDELLKLLGVENIRRTSPNEVEIRPAQGWMIGTQVLAIKTPGPLAEFLDKIDPVHLRPDTQGNMCPLQSLAKLRIQQLIEGNILPKNWRSFSRREKEDLVKPSISDKSINDATPHVLEVLSCLAILARHVADSNGISRGNERGSGNTDQLYDRAQEEVSYSTFDRLDKLTCSNWISDELIHQLHCVRDHQGVFEIATVIKPSVHEAICELGRQFVLAFRSALEATVISAPVEFNRILSIVTHPTEMRDALIWLRSNRHELLAVLDSQGCNRLESELLMESARLQKLVKSVPLIRAARQHSDAAAALPMTEWRVVLREKSYELLFKDSRMFTSVGKFEQEIDPGDRMAWKVAFAMGSPVQGSGMKADDLVVSVGARTVNAEDWTKDMARKVRRFLERVRFDGVSVRYDDPWILWEITI